MFHEQMKCEVLEVRYDFASRIGRVYAKENNFVDMLSTIAFFKTIDKGVLLIETYSGKRKDVRYRLIDGNWSVIGYY